MTVVCDSQRSAVPAQCFFGLPGEPVPCFPSLSIGEGWSAGRRPGSLAIGSLRPALRSAGLHAELPGPKCWRGWGARGARASCAGARAPLGASSRTALSAAAPCAVIRRRDRRRPRRSKAWRWYRAGKRKEGLFELECEFTGEREFPKLSRRINNNGVTRGLDPRVHDLPQHKKTYVRPESSAPAHGCPGHGANAPARAWQWKETP